MTYLRTPKFIQTNRSYEGREQQDNVQASRHPDEFRIQSILSAIQRGKFKYYVCGGFNRIRGLHLDPLRLAKLHNLNVDECLFEIKDPRIECAVDEFGLTRVTPKTHKPPKSEYPARVTYPAMPVRQVNFNQVIEQGDW